jgi:GPI inositol-deacylase
MIFNGAPVLFIPGNSGSYKQTRSLASVALRKGIDNDWFHHLDFFTVDLNEEYSALFGGALEDQTLFIEHSIRAILKLYERLPHPPDKIVVIAHSIGGKIAQKLLSSPDTAQLINTVITLASPMDKPVLNWDHHIDSFYRSIDEYWMENRQIFELPSNNSCGLRRHRTGINPDESRMLDDKLLITIGGGSKDLLVHSGLTDSKFSDIHVMTTAMSKVWVESDHLCIVWCLQLVLVVNRFLYSIIAPVKYKGSNSKGLSFIEDKAIRLAKAEQYFLGMSAKKGDDKTRQMESPDDSNWVEDNRRIFTQKFKNGTNRSQIQMIRLVDNVLYRNLRVEVMNQETDEWIFGCEAIETTGQSRFCSKATLLSKNYVTKVPSEFPGREYLQLNLHELKSKHPKWTHVLLKFGKTREPFQYTVDIHNSDDRVVKVVMPKWYSFTTKKILDDTLLGSSHFQLNITGLDETHQALELIVTPKFCSKHRTAAKICIPWTDGFDRFHQFSDDSSMILWTPKSRPINYNTTSNPIVVELLLDPSCRYTLSVRQSLGQMLARIVQQFSHWLPAHLVAILCLAIKHQITLTPSGEKFKCGSFHKALATCTPFFVITVSRLFFKFILMMKILPKPETLPASITVSVLIHGASLALLTCFTGATWASVTFAGSIAHKILFKIVHLPIPIISDTCVSIIEKFPASVAVLLVSLAFASCGGIAIFLACFIYFILVS